MTTSSLVDSSDDVAQVAGLRSFVEPHLDELRDGRLGERIHSDLGDFELLALRRNAVYRVGGNSGWYLKIPRYAKRRGDPLGSLLRRELDGFGLAGRALANESASVQPTVVWLADGDRYLLTSAVGGGHLHSGLYRYAAVTPPSLPFHKLKRRYLGLGRIVARLHRDVSSAGLPDSSREPILEELLSARARSSAANSRFDELDEWLADAKPAPDKVFIHGNLRRENIVAGSDGRVCLLDWEDSGLGCRYDDLSGLCAGLVLTRTAVLFPWRRVYLALGALLAGYREIVRYDREMLARHIAMRVALQYVWTHTPKSLSVARVPVSRTRTASLLSSLLHGRLQDALPGVDI